VDDTLLLVKPENNDMIHKCLNSFDPSLRFTIDIFDTAAPRFLDLNLDDTDVQPYVASRPILVCTLTTIVSPLGHIVDKQSCNTRQMSLLCCNTTL